MEILKEFIANHVLFASIIAWLISQLVKATINFCVYKKFSFERLFGDGGMPSAHSATVMALTVMMAWTVGFGSGAAETGDHQPLRADDRKEIYHSRYRCDADAKGCPAATAGEGCHPGRN